MHAQLEAATGRGLTFAIICAVFLLFYVGGYPAAYLLMGLSLLATLWCLVFRPPLPILREPAIWLPPLALLLIAIATAISAEEIADIRFAGNFVMFLLFVPLVGLFSRFAGASGTALVAGLALLGSALAFVVAAIQVFVFDYARARGFGSDPIWSAEAAVIVGFLSLIGFAAWRTNLRYVLLLGPLLGTMTSLLAGSRGPLLAVPFLALLALLVLVRRWWIGLAAALGLAALVLAAMVIFWPQGIARLQTIPVALEQLLGGGTIAERSSRLRVEMYASALSAIGEAPLAGHGFPRRMAAINRYMPDGGASFRTPGSPVYGNRHLHSDILDIGVGAGLLVILAYFMALSAPVLATYRSVRDSQWKARNLGAALLWVGYLVCGLTYILIGYEYHTTLFVCLAAMLVGFCRDAPAPDRAMEQAMAMRMVA